MGSAAAWQLARRGQHVIGFDRFQPPHEFGSSHGRSRIIREAYYEHPLYVPLVRRAYVGWAELEEESGRTLLRMTGGLMIGPGDGELVAGARRSALAHGLPYEELTAAEVRRRFPALHPPEGQVAILEPRAGVLSPDACVETALDRARTHGAELQFGEAVERWRPEGDAIALVTRTTTWRARRLILAAGAWTESIAQLPDVPFEVERQVVFWFHPAARPEQFAPECCPIWMWEWTAGRFVYGFPDLGDGVKVARHHDGEITTVERAHRAPRPGEEGEIRTLLIPLMPDALGPLRDASVCLYTNTPDRHFLIDTHPDDPRVLVASACSGHGFKFASAIGEILADLTEDRQPSFDLTPFNARRFRR
jgi:sarcosine oxidase